MASHVKSPTPPAVDHPQQQQGGQSTASPSRTSFNPSPQSSELTIAFINCVGQSKFTLPKQLEIQSYMRSHKIDIIHLQECMIDEDSFSECHYVRNNFNVLSNNTPGNTPYGTASLVRSDIEVTNILTDDSGRIILFDAVGCTWGNFYLPSGTDGASRTLREHYCAELIPQLMINRKKNGAVGGDLNSITSVQDSIKNAGVKMSPSFKTLVSAFSLTDSFRCLHPKKVQFSRYYSSSQQGEGASRIDRCYHWGELRAAEAEYHSISFSDHLSQRLIYTLPSPLDRQVAPKSKSQFKIPPEVVNDPDFKEKLSQNIDTWNQVLEAGADPMTWWQHLVKKGILQLAREHKREMNKERQGQLNLLLVRQAYLTSKLLKGDLSYYTALEEVKLRISKWFHAESEKIILLSRAHDINMNEKVRIYHHDLHRKLKQKSAILKLQTPSGIVEGHEDCAAAVEKNVADHLLQPANLDPAAQEILLREVEPCFTEADNLYLEAPPTKEEVKQVLLSCNSHAAPGTDGLTAFFYKKHWDLMGDLLTNIITRVFMGTKPSSCQRCSLMVFGNKPGKKAKSLLISDRRKISLLNVDFKVMTGIEAARIRKSMTRTISPNQLVTGGDRRISHGVAKARDAIHAASSLKTGCGILDTDLVAAFCNMVLTWCLQVLERKGLSEKVIKRYENLYKDHVSIIVVNTCLGRSIKNARLTIRQGDKFAMELFTFGMDPVLTYLEKRLKGIMVHSLPVQGPVPQNSSSLVPTVLAQPNLPGFPMLPAPPKTQLVSKATLPPIVTKYTLTAYCDDLKPAITNMYEFHLVERVMTVFELSSGCKMHRDPESQKCKFLPLSKWKTLSQNEIPFNFFTISDHLDFLGVTLKANTAATRKVNGDALQDKIRKTIGPWRGGRFMDLNLRPHSINCFALSKLQYRFNVIDPRVADSKYFLSQAKSFIYADLLEKPEEKILYRDVIDGGLGLFHIESRAKAALIATFLQTAANPSFQRDFYHNTLLRHYVLEEPIAAPSIPPHFRGEFFPNIRALREEIGSLESLTFKTIYKFLVKSLLKDQGDDNGERKLLPLKCEIASPNTDWQQTWRYARLKGLGPELTTFLLKMVWGILPSGARLAKFLPKTSPDCQLCKKSGLKIPESLEHALFNCAENKETPGLLIKVLKSYDPNVTPTKLLTLDINLESHMEIPLLWIIATTLSSIWTQRQEGKICAAKTRAQLEARCRLLREGRGTSLENAFTLADIAIQAMYA